MSAFFVASVAEIGVKPSLTARSPLGVPGSSATITVQPLSRRFWAWACPCEP